MKAKKVYDVQVAVWVRAYTASKRTAEALATSVVSHVHDSESGSAIVTDIQVLQANKVTKEPRQ